MMDKVEVVAGIEEIVFIKQYTKRGSLQKMRRSVRFDNYKKTFSGISSLNQKCVLTAKKLRFLLAVGKKYAYAPQFFRGVA